MRQPVRIRIAKATRPRRAQSFLLKPLAPFRLDLTVWTLRRRPENTIDRWDGHTYRRVLALGAGPVELAVTQIRPALHPRLKVSIEGLPLRAAVKAAVTATLERLLGLRLDLAEFYRFARKEARLRELATRFKGMKPPRFATTFEGVLNGIACQQLSLNVGILLLNRLARLCGVPFQRNGQTVYAFPRTEEVARQNISAFRRLGFSRHKGEAMLEVARAITEGHLDLDAVTSLPDDTSIAQLRTLKGVGRWTAEYVLLRSLGRTHLFPGDDVGGRNKLQHWLGRRAALDYDQVHAILERWHPYAGLLYFHLLLDGLAASGLVRSN